MIRIMIALACLLTLTTQGEARARHHHRTVVHVVADHSKHFVRHHRGHRSAVDVAENVHLGGRPSAWCGWYMRSLKGGGPEYNLARNWAHRGTATSPQIGAVVVWAHHVGLITGRASNGEWVVKSGNDGHQVRERPRSVGGAIAFRMV